MPDEPLVARELGADPLEHDVALEAFDAVAPAEEDLGHATRREVPEHHVPAEPSRFVMERELWRRSTAWLIRHRRAPRSIICTTSLHDDLEVTPGSATDPQSFYLHPNLLSPVASGMFRHRQSAGLAVLDRTGRTTTITYYSVAGIQAIGKGNGRATYTSGRERMLKQNVSGVYRNSIGNESHWIL